MMQALSPVIAVLLASSLAMADGVQIKIDPIPESGKIHIRNRDARQQLYVTAIGLDARPSDVTRGITWSVVPEGLVAIDETGLVTPLADGEATITASFNDKATVQIPIAVSGFASPLRSVFEITSLLSSLALAATVVDVTGSPADKTDSSFRCWVFTLTKTTSLFARRIAVVEFSQQLPKEVCYSAKRLVRHRMAVASGWKAIVTNTEP